MIDSEPVFGMWWIPDSYLLTNGVLRPRSGSAFRAFDPWRDHTALRGHQVSEPPYLSLANAVLHPGITRDSEGVLGADGAAAGAILAWVGRFGLLGIGPHQVERVEMHLPYMGGGAYKVVVQERRDGGWNELPSTDSRSTAEPTVRGHVAGGGPSKVTLETHWLPFFPDVPSDEARVHWFPLPLTNQFWAAYGEPLHEFLRVAQILTRAVLVPGGAQRTAVGDDFPPPDGNYLDAERAIRALNGFRHSARYVYAPGKDGTVRRKWSFPSLLSMLAVMAGEDLSAGYRIRRCKRCDRLFRYSHGQARYCSDRCRWASQKIAQRSRPRKKKPLQGNST